MEHFFTILGGMGTMATESFVRILNQRTPAHRDQDYLNYMVLNHATVPDRTAYILGESSDNPLPALSDDIQKVTPLHPDFFVLTCNTAHYFYDELQSQTSIPIIHMPRLAAQKVAEVCRDMPNARVMVLATKGTMQSGVYSKELEKYPQLEVVEPSDELQDEVMSLIYDDIKEHQYLNNEKFESIIHQAMEKEHCDAVILGCTELSLMQEHDPIPSNYVIDAQSELADEVLRRQKKV